MIKIQNKMDRIQDKLVTIFYYILRILISFGISFFLSQCILFENFSPFSLILFSISYNIGLIPTVCYLGGTIGTLFNPFDLSSFKYITALTMIYVIYMLFQKSFKVIRYDTAVFTAACLFLSGFLFLLVGQLSLFNVLVLIGESVLICCCIYFVNYAVNAFKKNCYLSSKEIIAASITLVLVFCTLHNIYLFNLSIARVLGIFLILLSLYCLKTSHVVVLGSCIGIILSAVSSGGEVMFITVVTATLAGCLFSSFSNKFSVTSFVLIYYSSLVFLGRFPWSFWYFLEPIVASFLVAPIPKKKLRKILSSYIPIRQSMNEGSSKSESENKNEIGEMVEQLNYISKRLESVIDDEGMTTMNFDDLEHKLSETFKNEGLKVKDIRLLCDNRKSMSGSVTFEDQSVVEIKDKIKDILSTQLKFPFILKTEQNKIILKEVNPFFIQCAALCRAKDCEAVCGDQAIGFSIDKKRYCLILSDGMGCGRQAGAYSELTVSVLKRLLQSGMSISNTLNILRSVIRFNPKETFSTLDLCIINLETGIADFYKSGAYDSYFIKSDQCIRIDGGGLPMGLSEEEQIIHKQISFSENEYLVMISDGLAISKDEEECLKECKNEDPQIFAKNILKRFSYKNDDDITVMICHLNKTAI